MPTKRDFKSATLLGSDGLSVPIDVDVALDGNTLFIDSSTNRVGIGTPTPSRQLEVYNTGSPTLRFNHNATSWDIRTNGSQGSALQFDYGGTAQILVKSDGNVGIGTTSPTRQLHVSEIAFVSGTTPQFRLSSSATDTDDGLRAIFGLATNTNHFVGGAVSGDAILRTTSSGNLLFGIGSTERMRITSAGELQLTGNGVLKNQESGGNYSYLQQTSSDARLYVQYSQPLLFGTTATERMRITSGGNVGIGTTSPGATLNIVKSGDPRIRVTGTDSDDTAGIQLLENTNTPTFGAEFVYDGDNNTTYIGQYNNSINVRKDIAINRGTGYVGIGTTSPDRKLDVSGTGNVYGKFQSTNATGAGIELQDTGEDWLIQADDGAGNGGLAFYDLARTSYRVMFDANGKVGIGTTSPDARLDVYQSTIGATGYQNGIRLHSTSGIDSRWFEGGGSDMAIGTYSNHNFGIRTNNTERLTIGSAGNLHLKTVGTSSIFQIGSTTQGRVNGTSIGGISYYSNSSNSGTLDIGSVDSAPDQINFYTSSGFAGKISSSTTSTTYGTSSDYRLKENITAIINATERLKQLNPVRFNFIADADTTVDGFLAHEVSEHIPEAVTGTKDEVNENGDAIYQCIDQSKLVPLLVATIKELEARITELENNK